MKVRALKNFWGNDRARNKEEVFDLDAQQAADWIKAGLVDPVGLETETEAFDTREFEVAVTRTRKGKK